MTRVIIVKRFETVYDSIKRYISIAIIIIIITSLRAFFSIHALFSSTTEKSITIFTIDIHLCNLKVLNISKI